MRILVFQTTRMGDVLQTSPLIRGLRRKYPDAHIALLTRRMGKSIAEHNPDVNEVLVYDEDEMFFDLRAKDSMRLLKAYRIAEAYIEKLRARQFDLAYNCTHSFSSAILIKLANIPKVVGAHLSDDWQFVLRGRWVTYFYTSVFHREYNDLNLCDITAGFLEDVPPCQHLVFEARDGDRAFVDNLLKEHNVQPGEFIACFQLGASEESKRWPEHRFAELARLLVEKYHARIFLVGVDSEAPLGETFAKHAPGLATPLFGKTSVPQLAALLERANVLVTNDTGTMHIAASVRCPITLVSVGYVHFRETGPYGAGHCAVEWRRPRIGAPTRDGESAEEERARVTAQHVLLAVETAIAKRETPLLMPETAATAGVHFFVSGFAPDGCLYWGPAIRRPIEETDFLRMAYRLMWMEYLRETPGRERESAMLDHMLAGYLSPAPEELDAWLASGLDAFGQFAAMARRGEDATERLLVVLSQPGGLREAQPIVSGLMRLDEEMRVFALQHPPCNPLARIARYERDNLEGSDPRGLAKTTLGIYQQAKVRAERLMAKLRVIAVRIKG